MLTLLAQNTRILHLNTKDVMCVYVNENMCYLADSTCTLYSPSIYHHQTIPLRKQQELFSHRTYNKKVRQLSI